MPSTVIKLRESKLAEVINMSRVEEIKTQLEEKQYDFKHSEEFEKALKEAFEFLGFNAEHHGGSGDTDVLVTAQLGKEKFKVSVDGKTNKKGKIPESHINWTSLEDHKKNNHSDFIMVIGPSFAGGNLERRAEEKEVSLLTTKGIIKLMQAHDESPFTLLELKKLFEKHGLVDDIIDKLITTNEDKIKQMKNLEKIIKTMQGFQDKKEGYFTAIMVYGKLAEDNIEQKEILSIIELLKIPLIGAVKELVPAEKPENKGYILTMNLKDIKNIFYQLSEIPQKDKNSGPPTPPAKSPSEPIKKQGNDYTGTKPRAFSLNGEKYEIRKWSEVIMKVSEILYEEHTDEFKKVLNLQGRKRPYYTTHKEELRSPKKILETNIYVETNLSANSTVSLLRKVIQLFGYDEESLIIEVDGKVTSKYKKTRRQRSLLDVG